MPRELIPKKDTRMDSSTSASAEAGTSNDFSSPPSTAYGSSSGDSPSNELANHESESDTINSLPTLTKGKETVQSPESMLDDQAGDSTVDDSWGEPPKLYHGPPRDKMNPDLLVLHPFCQTLNIHDLDACVELENAAFPPHERATREKILYRLTKCGSLCFGTFSSVSMHDDSPLAKLAKESSSRTVTSYAPERRMVLLGHIIATLGTHGTVLDDDMRIPEHWQTDPTSEPHLGHKILGRTLCIHSIAVRPGYQGIELGKMMVTAYLQRMKSAQVCDKAAIIAHDSIAKGFYERCWGFRNLGASSVEFGGGGWVDCVVDMQQAHPWMPAEH